MKKTVVGKDMPDKTESVDVGFVVLIAISMALASYLTHLSAKDNAFVHAALLFSDGHITHEDGTYPLKIDYPFADQHTVFVQDGMMNFTNLSDETCLNILTQRVEREKISVRRIVEYCQGHNEVTLALHEGVWQAVL